MSKNIRSECLVYDCNASGHRGNYVSTIADLVNGTPLVSPIKSTWWRLLTVPKLLLTTVETAPRTYTIILLLRSLLGRRSVGIFLRAHLTGNGKSAASRFRNAILRLLSCLPRLSLLSIVPMDRTRYAASFTFISDPEFWDITEGRSPPEETLLSQQALSFAGKRPVLLFAGHVEAGRGISLLADLAEAGIAPAIVVCGKVMADAADAVRRLSAAGAMVEARFISDDELLSTIRAATYVWCCFPPERDMSSGLFGRAMQLGAMPVVRRGSVLEAMSEHLTPALVLDFADADAAKQAFSNPPPSRAVFDGAPRLREDARRKLLAALR